MLYIAACVVDKGGEYRIFIRRAAAGYANQHDPKRRLERGRLRGLGAALDRRLRLEDVDPRQAEGGA